MAVKRQQPWRSGPVAETRRLYLDPDSYLPFAEELERASGGYTTREWAEYAHEFIPSGGVPADFFDPLALRRARPDPQGVLDQPPPGFVLYWLGTRFAAGTRVPPLELWRVRRFNPADHPWVADRFMLEYTNKDDLSGGEPLLRIWASAREVWEAVPSSRIDPEGPCWTREEIDLPGGRATIFLGFSWPGDVPPAPGDCPSDRSHDRFLVHAFLEETVVVVQPWNWPDETREAIEIVVRALRPRQP